MGKQNIYSKMLRTVSAVCAFVLLFANSIVAQIDTSSLGEEPFSMQDLGFDFETAAKEVNVLNSFLHKNNNTFSITIYDFKGEKVQVFVHNATTGARVYAVNIEPTEDIYEVHLLAQPLPKGNYYVIVKGESRVIPKQMTIH